MYFAAVLAIHPAHRTAHYCRARRRVQRSEKRTENKHARSADTAPLPTSPGEQAEPFIQISRLKHVKSTFITS